MSLFRLYPTKLFFVVIVTALFPTFAHAQDGSYYYAQEDMLSNERNGFYLSANVGGEVFIPGSGKSSIYKKGGVGQSVGYQFDDHWAAELGAEFFNESAGSLSVAYLAAKGILPLSNSSTFLFLKLGYGMSTASIEFLGYESTAHKGGLFVGPGVEFGLTKNLGMTVEYNAIISRTKDVDGDNTYSLLGLLGLGLIYHF